MGTSVKNIPNTDSGRTLEKALTSARILIDREYLNHLSDDTTRVLPPDAIDFSTIRILHLTRIVYNDGEMASRLATVYHALSGLVSSLFLLIDGDADGVSLYLGIRSPEKTTAEQAFLGSLHGNLPGIEAEPLTSDRITALISHTLPYSRQNIAAVSQIPSRRAFESGQFHNQCLEQFLDSMNGQTYTAMIMAVPLSAQEIRNRRGSLENLYTTMTPAARRTVQYTVSENDAIQHSIANGVMESVSDGVSSGTTLTTGATVGNSRGNGNNVHFMVSNIGLGLGGTNSQFASAMTQLGTTTSAQQTTQKGNQRTEQNGTTHGTGQALTQSVTLENKAVLDLMQQIDEHIKRIEQSESYGLWECCGFFLAETPGTALIAASNYRALLSGENSCRETVCTNIWRDGVPQTRVILEHLRGFSMPQFHLQSGMDCTPGSLVNGAELPLQLGLPEHSVNGVVVTPMARFGRAVHYLQPPAANQRLIGIGHVYHMGNVENTAVRLSLDALTSHSLFAGTTGTGKSTCISKIVSVMGQFGVKCLIIEPVKGEYKTLLGRLPGLKVYTLDPLQYRMLRINPFQFEGGTVLQHIDRLMQVFEVVWPLYAGQPAMLRDCIQRSYVKAGWDTANSIYLLDGTPRFPTFETLLEVIPEAIAESHFVGESRGSYEGALLTRVRMLTVGTFGQVFEGTVSMTDQELFEENVIVDLSAGSSQEVVSLIMGILIIRLREYLTENVRPGNLALRHLTILEEAHNILSAQNDHNVEGGVSISGQSAQMLANSIAEMRTYGEGFIISDQAPGALHPAAIRNTATKVIFRLPEAEDRNTITQSLSLNERQSDEFARLPDVTAVISQRGWVEPVLTRISPDRHTYYLDQPVPRESYARITRLCGNLARVLLMQSRAAEYDMERLLGIVDEAGLLPGTSAHYQALLQAFHEQYHDIAHEIRDRADLHAPFYSALLASVMQCEDLFTIHPLPRAGKGYTAPLERDSQYRAACEQWRDTIIAQLSHYAAGLSHEEAVGILEYLLIYRMTPLRITVHNALYGIFRSVSARI